VQKRANERRDAHSSGTFAALVAHPRETRARRQLSAIFSLVVLRYARFLPEFRILSPKSQAKLHQSLPNWGFRPNAIGMPKLPAVGPCSLHRSQVAVKLLARDRFYSWYLSQGFKFLMRSGIRSLLSAYRQVRVPNY
jgi:hypothetical protein